MERLETHRVSHDSRIRRGSQTKAPAPMEDRPPVEGPAAGRGTALHGLHEGRNTLPVRLSGRQPSAVMPVKYRRSPFGGGLTESCGGEGIRREAPGRERGDEGV